MRPDLLVCLGATSARALLGPDFRVTRQRGEFFRGPSGTTVLATIHPSAILRLRDDGDRESEYRNFVADLSRAANWAQGRARTKSPPV